ncbi:MULTISPECIES: winged helix-turn-helix domain-containing protein [Halobacteriales]|uniref:winged helix-turn-helix domain-containing protein n=1 Tax=Halobacteriales TaxID=2235 RepID=UPI00210CD33B|nr:MULTISPECIES: winged helix-turn-helix domain-containing protein [Halobacteria]
MMDKIYDLRSPLIVMRMSRTNPSEALERLAWTLNYPRRDPISINELAEKTDLSWATTQKYVQLLETLGRIGPKITIDEDGVVPQQLGENLHDIRDQKDMQLIIYLYTHANIQGSPTEPLDVEKHSEVLEHYDEVIDELAEFGWIELTEETIQLTPEGVSIAAPAQSRIRDNDLDVTSSKGTTQATPASGAASKADILVADAWVDVSSSGSFESEQSEDSWDKDNDWNRQDTTSLAY